MRKETSLTIQEFAYTTGIGQAKISEWKMVH